VLLQQQQAQLVFQQQQQQQLAMHYYQLQQQQQQQQQRQRQSQQTPNQAAHHKSRPVAASLPSSTTQSFLCEPCNASFASAHALQQHQGNHKKCSEASCSFVASGSAMELHYLREHDELYKRLVPRSIETDEEIAAWRDARRRNFPTKDKIASAPPVANERAKKKRRVCRHFERTGTCRNGDKCPFEHSEERHAAQQLSKARKLGARPAAPRGVGAQKPTLLKKLLAKEIASSNEPAVLAQCIAYIVANDFFDAVPLTLAVDGNEDVMVEDDDSDDEEEDSDDDEEDSDDDDDSSSSSSRNSASSDSDNDANV
jgi:hypothetical protein